MDLILEMINSELERWSVITKQKEKALKKAPEGRLRVSAGHNRKQYYHVTGDQNSDGVYLGKNKEKLVSALAQKQYDQVILKEAVKRKKMLQKMKVLWQEDTSEKIYEELPEYRRKWVHPIVQPNDIFVRQWLEKPYEKAVFGMNEKVFITNQGERVRSKSEIMIANRLLERGIPYKYECRLALPDGTFVLPDFTILNVRLRKELYYEHFGMMDVSGYVNRNIMKLREYQNNGIWPGDRLFFTMETDQQPFNMHDLDMLIDRYFQ